MINNDYEQINNSINYFKFNSFYQEAVKKK